MDIPANTLEDKEINKDDTNSKMKYVYKKRSGTSGVTGQLYETKLLSLILFRALKDNDVKDFYLGNNLNDIGAFDDICFKFKLQNKNVVVFMQVKHRDDPRKGGITDGDLRNSKSDFSLQKYFNSYIKIKRKFDEYIKYNNDIMFSDVFENTELCFIIYTPICDRITKKSNKNNNDIYITKIKELITTGADENIFQISYNESDINTLSDILLEEQLDAIISALLECVTISESESKALSQKTIDVLSKYQSFLIPNVIEICGQTPENDNEFCEAKINPSLFFSNNIVLINFRNRLFKDLLSRSEYNKDEAVTKVKALINCRDDNSLDLIDLNNIVGNVIIIDSKSNNIELAATAPKELQIYKQDINEIPISQTTFREIYYETGKKKIESVPFRIPKLLSKLLEEPTDSNKIFNEANKIAKEFLDKLYFFTKEARQCEVENILKRELDLCNDTKPFFPMHCEGVFLKLHDKVQKWAMLQGNAYYLTKSCDYIEKSRSEVIDSPYLTTLNFNCICELRKYNIQFKNEAIDKLLNKLSIGVTNIVTKVKYLTCIKLMQGLDESKCSFINLDLVKHLRPYEFKLLLKEFDTAKFDILVLIYYDTDNDSSDILDDMFGHFKKDILIVTNEILSTEYKELNCSVLIEKENSFADLNQESQDRLLSYDQVVSQGEVVSLGQILINNESKNLLITDEIIDIILKHETLNIGKNLEDEKYASAKNYYLPRYLSIDDVEFTLKIDNLKSIKKNVVVITAEPGMGKSTLLTHISMETKRIYPNCWIVRVNLLDHCSELFKWQKERKDINLCDTMTLICKAELGNISGDFELQIIDDILLKKRCNIKGLALFHLELIIHCYNNETIIFIFDGFDEICPHYKKEAIKFIRNVIPKNKRIDDNDEDNDAINSIWVDIRTINGEFSEEDMYFRKVDKAYDENCLRRVWITSRPYDYIKQTLEDEFGISYKLKPLSIRDQSIYYQRYFHANIKLNELSFDQFKNIESFFEFMSQYRRSHNREHKNLHLTSIPLNNVYEAAVDHFRNDILYAPIDVDKEKLIKEWVSSKELLSVLERCNGSIYEMCKASKLASIPLHMHVAANYFVNEIKDTETKKNVNEKWDLNLNTFDYYKGFVETKFKSIRLQEKNRRYIDCPDERSVYENEKREFIEGHKQLAFYAMFHNSKYYLRKLVSRKELTKIKEMIRKIKRGEEKTGLIYRINTYDNVPMFVHMVFAEYFAVEYITDKLKLAKNDRKLQILDFIINELLLQDENGLISVLDFKLKYDEDLIKVLSDSECKKNVFDLLLAQNCMTEWECKADDDIYDINDAYYEKKIEPALAIAIGSGSTEVTMFLLSTLEANLNEANIETFVELIKDTFFIGAALIKEDNIITYVLDKFRSIDTETMNEVLKRSKIRKFLTDSGTMKSNEDIVKLLHSHVIHITTPYWYYDDDTHQFQSIYFNDSL